MNSDNCPLTIALKAINGKYEPLIIRLLFINNNMRYNDILKEIDNITPKALSSSLKKLLKNNIIEKDYIKNKFVYKLTGKGLKLKNTIYDLENWQNRNI